MVLIPPDNETNENTEADELTQNEQFKFTHETILLMLSSIQKKIEKFRNRTVKKDIFWKDIAQIFKVFGHVVNHNDLYRKFRNLKATYLKIKDRHKKTGEGRQSWPYYEEFEQIFLNDMTVNAATHLNIISTTSSTDKPRASQSQLDQPKLNKVNVGSPFISSPGPSSASDSPSVVETEELKNTEKKNVM